MTSLHHARVRSAVVLVSDNSLCLIKRVRNGQTYYLFPGGTVEAGETPEAAAAREAFEELGLEVAVGRLVAEVQFVEAQQLFYTAERLGGVFGSGRGKELTSPENSASGSYTPVWLTFDDTKKSDVRPKRLVEHLISGGLEPGQVLRFSE